MSGIKKKHRYRALAVGIAMVMTVGCILQVSACNKKSGTVGEPQETVIIIHTFSGEDYVAAGTVDIMEAADEGAETVIEMQGSIEMKKNPEENTDYRRMWDDRRPPVAVSVNLPSGEVYGFYGYSLHDIRDNGGDEPIEIYGYLEGYYNIHHTLGHK